LQVRIEAKPAYEDQLQSALRGAPLLVH